MSLHISRHFIFLGAFLPIFAIQSQFPWCRMPALWQTPCSTCLVPFTVFIRSSNVEVDVIWWRILEKCSGADVTFADNSCQSALSLSSAIHVQKLCKNCAIAHLNLKFAHQGEKNPHTCFLVTISPSPSPQSLPSVSIILRQMLKSHPIWKIINHHHPHHNHHHCLKKWPHLFDTFQVGRKKAELDRLVQRSLRRCLSFFTFFLFILSLILWKHSWWYFPGWGNTGCF